MVRKHTAVPVNTAMSCGGVIVEPGDVVLGDRDGIVTKTSTRTSTVLATAEKRELGENALRAGIAAGRTTVDLLNLAPQLARHGLE